MTITINGTTGITSPGGDLSVSQGLSGNLNFTGTGNRITGDFSNATIASRVLLQSSTTNGQSALGLLPNGTSTQTQYLAFNSTDPANSSYIQALISATEARINSGQLGTGTNLPMTFYTGGSERVRIDTSGNVGIGTSSPLAKLQVYPTVGAPASSGNLNTGVIFAEGAGGPSLNMGNFNSGGTYYAWIQSAFVNNAAVVQPLVLQQIGGNVGIGTTLPQAKIDLGVGTGRKLNIYNDTSNAISGFGTDLSGSGYELSCFAGGNGVGLGVFTWSGYNRTTDSYSERMRIDSSGNLLVGTATHADNAKAIISFTGGSSASRGLVMTSGSTASTAMIAFKNPNGYAQGEILTSGSTTSYNTSSDYRLKENVAPMTGALTKVAQLKPVTYTWKADGSDGQGFIAHELQAVVPDCVTGTKDAVDKDGKPQHQGVDTSFLVATLVAAIQELTARLEALENK
jgi:hypothetical protein